LPSRPAACAHRAAEHHHIDRGRTLPRARCTQCQGQYREEKAQRHHPGTARRRVGKVLQTTREEAQANGQQRAQHQCLHQAGSRCCSVVGLVVFQPSAKHEEHDADGGCPQGPCAAEKAMVHGARNEADARVFEEHGPVMKLKRNSHECDPFAGLCQHLRTNLPPRPCLRGACCERGSTQAMGGRKWGSRLALSQSCVIHRACAAGAVCEQMVIKQPRPTAQQ